MSSQIAGVTVADLPVFPDERGEVRRMLRADGPTFAGFGEIYFSAVREGAVKAWRRHREMVAHLAVPVGAVRLVLFDDRSDAASAGAVEEWVLSEEAYRLVTVPPGIWTGFQGLGPGRSLLANLASIPHDDGEVTRRDPDDARIPYQWS